MFLSFVSLEKSQGCFASRLVGGSWLVHCVLVIVLTHAFDVLEGWSFVFGLIELLYPAFIVLLVVF